MQIAAYLKKAIDPLEGIEVEIHSEVKKIINEADDAIQQVPYQPEGLYLDPRPDAIESLRDEVMKDMMHIEKQIKGYSQ